ncbi:MAG: ABC transporter ATP-binding protein, partial [Acetobacteraceae bacterium]|nr:ABC transporter ATP-binding protein [Acetobacteraceae bacterium]
MSAAGDVLLHAAGVGKRFGGFVALEDVDIELRAGERLGLIGPNGSGKSTFVNCISGDLAQHEGKVSLGGQPLDGLKPHRRARLGLARTFQLPQPFVSLTVLENVRVPLLFAGDPAAATRRAMECLEQVEMAEKAEKLPRELTQVEQRRLELARAIALDPRLLIADEAMAGLSNAEIDQILVLLRRLNAQGTAVIMIEHIMRAVTEFAERLVVFVAGRKIADGEPRDVLGMREVEDAYLGR